MCVCAFALCRQFVVVFFFLLVYHGFGGLLFAMSTVFSAAATKACALLLLFFVGTWRAYELNWYFAPFLACCKPPSSACIGRAIGRLCPSLGNVCVRLETTRRFDTFTCACRWSAYKSFHFVSVIVTLCICDTQKYRHFGALLFSANARTISTHNKSLFYGVERVWKQCVRKFSNIYSARHGPNPIFGYTLHAGDFVVVEYGLWTGGERERETKKNTRTKTFCIRWQTLKCCFICSALVKMSFVVRDKYRILFLDTTYLAS